VPLIDHRGVSCGGHKINTVMPPVMTKRKRGECGGLSPGLFVLAFFFMGARMKSPDY
jgi:hypothetical protein